MKTATGATLDLPRLATLVGALAVGALFWDSAVLWPLKLLVVMMHESGHALATLFVGGKVEHIRVGPDQSGQCMAYLPSGVMAQVAVYSAGYVGSAVAGAGMLLGTFRFRLHRAVPVVTAVWLAVMGVFYVRDLFTAAFCVATIAGLALAARYLPDGPLDLMNLFAAAFTALYVVFDLRDDLWHPYMRGLSDAALLSQRTYIPPVVWALVWTAFSLAILGAAAWASVRRRPKPV